MSGAIKKVILIGASGNIGTPVLKEFISSGIFKISVLSRESSTATFPSSVNVIKTDFSLESVTKAFEGQDAVVSLVGSSALGDQKAWVDAAVKAGVKRFLPSEFGGDGTNKAILEKLPLFATKGAVVDHLRSKEKDGLSWTSVVTGPFFDWGLQVGFLGYNVKEKTAQIWDGGNVPFTTTNITTISKAVVSLLSTPEAIAATENKYVYIASHTVTQNEILASFEKATGAKWTVESIDSKEAARVANEKLKNGDYSAFPDLIRSAFYASDELGNFSNKVSNELLGLLGLEKEDLDADIRTATASA